MAARETNQIKGKRICVSATVKFCLQGSKPLPIVHSTIGPAKSMPNPQTSAIPTAMLVNIRLASAKACSLPSLVIFLENVVVKAAERAPSARRSRSKFGIRKAVQKASNAALAPKTDVKTTSLRSPKTREQKIAAMVRTAGAAIPTRRDIPIG
jgi:hypothetical protein